MNWHDYVGKYIRVSQEVLLDGIWSELEFKGWVASCRDGVVVLDNGEEWTVEDGGEFVRGSKLLPCTSIGQPKWVKHPENWTKIEDGWDRNPIAPKVEGCDCAHCNLYEGTLVADPERLKKCDVLFVGEAPGYEEADRGHFFVGKAGKLLKSLIAQTNITNYTLNNTCLCYGDTPTPEDIRACNKRLLREVKAVSPKIVVAIGGVSLQALTGLTGITEYQGLLMDWKVPNDEEGQEAQEATDTNKKGGVERVEGQAEDGKERPLQESIKLLPCFHSAAVLRRPDLFNQFAETIYKAAMFLKGEGNIDVQPEDFIVHVVKDGIVDDKLMKAEMLYVDLETTDYSPYKDKIICVSVTPKGLKESWVFPWPIPTTLKSLLELTPCSGWNMFFDAQFLRQNDVMIKVAGDVMLKHYTLDETTMSQGLKPSARRYCNAPDWEAPLKEYLPTKSTPFSAIPPEILYPYNAYDSGYTMVLDEIISARMDDNNRRVYNEILIPALNMFLDTCAVGLRVDVDKLSELRTELLAKQETVRKQLEEMSGVPGFNPSSIRDARYLVNEVLGITSEGTSRQALEDYKDIAGVQLLLSYRETRKLLGTYIEGLVDDIVKGDVVHPNIRLNGTVTGRLSSANPNFFGMPEEKGGIKKLYKARHDGWGVGNGDGAQMEIRVLGALSNDRQMIEDFVKGVDFHGAARNRLYGRGFAKSNYNHQEVLDAKTAVFGPIYGRGALSMAMQFYHSEIAALKDKGEKVRWLTWSSLPRSEQEIRVRQAQEHIDKLWEPYPTALAWLENNSRRAQEEGELITYYGRYRRWGLVTEDNLESIRTEGRNCGVQGPSSDTNLLVMHSSYKHFPREVYLPIFPVHDSVVFTYRLGEEKWLVPELKSFFEKKAQELLHTDMKFEYTFSTGPNWGEQTEWKS